MHAQYFDFKRFPPSVFPALFCIFPHYSTISLHYPDEVNEFNFRRPPSCGNFANLSSNTRHTLHGEDFHFFFYIFPSFRFALAGRKRPAVWIEKLFLTVGHSSSRRLTYSYFSYFFKWKNWAVSRALCARLAT